MTSKTTKPNLVNKFLISFLTILTIVLAVSTSFLSYDKFIVRKNENKIDFSTRNEVRRIIEKNYLNSIPSDKDFQKGELRGFVAALEDPYSEYLVKADGEKFNDTLNQRYEGVGIRFNQLEVDIVVDKVFKNSPAEKAGVLKGDVLKAVDDKDTLNQKVTDVADKIRGPKDTVVKLTVSREGKNQVFSITRQKVVTDLIYLDFEGDTAIIEITSFGENLDQKMAEITKQIKAKSEIKNIIVDLRGDSGGLLDQAVEVISYFVEPNSIALYEKDKNSQDPIRTSLKSPSLENYNLAVLVDNYSASASEIMAGAMRDLKKAKIVGQKTFGKGVVQRLFELNNGDKLKLTIAEWLTPNGTQINKKGLEVDIQVPLKEDGKKAALQSFKK